MGSDVGLRYSIAECIGQFCGWLAGGYSFVVGSTQLGHRRLALPTSSRNVEDHRCGTVVDVWPWDDVQFLTIESLIAESHASVVLGGTGIRGIFKTRNAIPCQNDSTSDEDSRPLSPNVASRTPRLGLACPSLVSFCFVLHLNR